MPRIEDVLTFGSGKAGGVRLERTPGSRFAYSDGGYLILQLLIEEVSGKDFSQYMQREILTPLGMSASSFQWRPDIQSQIVTSYSETGKPFPHYLFIEKAPAGLYTTAPDLARLVAAGMKGPNGEPPGRGVLQPASVEQMMTPAIEIRGFERLIYAQGYGLGYFIETLPDGRRLVSHMGGNLNGVTEFAAIPASGEGKATIEVTTIYDDVAAGKIVSRQGDVPVLEGDLVANAVYDKTRKHRFVVVGRFDFNGNGMATAEGADRVKAMIQEWGGEVVDSIDTTTDFVVLGQGPTQPVPPGATASPIDKQRYQERVAQYEAFQNVVNEAKSLMVPILSQTQFLHYVGYNLNALRNGQLRAAAQSK